MSKSNTAWTCYLWTRALIGTPDFILDTLHAASLLDSGHPWWGGLTLAFPVLAVAAAAASVLVGRLRSGNPMGCAKFALLTLRALVALFEGLFESAPQLVLQLVVVFRGVHLEDLALLTDIDERFSWPWFRGLFHVLSMCFSFLSLVVTLVYYNEERWTSARPERFLSVLGLSVSCVMYRVFVCAVLFSTAPMWSVIITAVLYLTNLAVFKGTGQSWESILFSYAHLLAPSGFAKGAGDGFHSYTHHRRRFSYAGGDGGKAAPAVSSEVERAKINQEALIRRVKVSHILFTVTSVVIVVPYVVCLELYVFAADPQVLAADHSALISSLRSRALLYTIPVPLLLFSALFTYLHFAEARRGRDAARHWYAITPHRNRSASVPPTPHASTLTPKRGNILADAAAGDAATLPLASAPPPAYLEEEEREHLHAPHNNHVPNGDTRLRCAEIRRQSGEN